MNLRELSKAIVRAATPLRARQAVRKRIHVARHGAPHAPTLGNLETNTSYFARKYELNQTNYLEHIQAYHTERRVLGEDHTPGDGLARRVSLTLSDGSVWAGSTVDDLVAHNSLVHLAAMEFLLSEISKHARIIDIGCGMGHLFLHLYRLGYRDLMGVDESSFQPGVVDCAREFLAWYHTPVALLDVPNVGFHGHYKAKGLFGLFDVVTLFGMRGYCLYELAFELLKPGGYFIQETIEPTLGVYATDFTIVATYPGYGRRDRKPYTTIVCRKAV
jgi:SAM-dependent methyltransferase